MKNIIKKLINYTDNILGSRLDPIPMLKQDLGNLPMFLGEMYHLYKTRIFNQDFILIEYRYAEAFSIYQLEKHIKLFRDNLLKKIVLLLENLTSIKRRRLIEKGINFIVPGKQLFMPEFLIDLSENFQNPKVKKQEEKLLPSAQNILLFHILHRGEMTKLEDLSFTNLALYFGYTKMTISKAVDNLTFLEFCKVDGTKEKHLQFKADRAKLWRKALPYLINPVYKQIFVDEIPKGLFLLRSNESALQEYSDMNPSRQEYYAIERGQFYDLQKMGKLINPNISEGHYCLELWKYNPVKLSEGISEKHNVDPLSLYLSLQKNSDERERNALEMIIKKYVW